MPRPPRPGCGSAIAGAAAHALVYSTTPQTVPFQTSIILTWDHFQTTDSSVFGTQLGGGGVQNQPGDNQLVAIEDGFVVAQSSVVMESGAYQRYAIIDGSVGDFNRGLWTGPDIGDVYVPVAGVQALVDLEVDFWRAGSALQIRAYNGDGGDHDVTSAFLSALWFPRSAPEAAVY